MSNSVWTFVSTSDDPTGCTSPTLASASMLSGFKSYEDALHEMQKVTNAIRSNQPAADIRETFYKGLRCVAIIAPRNRYTAEHGRHQLLILTPGNADAAPRWTRDQVRQIVQEMHNPQPAQQQQETQPGRAQQLYNDVFVNDVAPSIMPHQLTEEEYAEYKQLLSDHARREDDERARLARTAPTVHHAVYGPTYNAQLIALCGEVPSQQKIIDNFPYDSKPRKVHALTDGRAVEIAARAEDACIYLYESSSHYFAYKNAGHAHEIDPETGREFGSYAAQQPAPQEAPQPSPAAPTSAQLAALQRRCQERANRTGETHYTYPSPYSPTGFLCSPLSETPQSNRASALIVAQPENAEPLPASEDAPTRTALNAEEVYRQIRSTPEREDDPQPAAPQPAAHPQVQKVLDTARAEYAAIGRILEMKLSGFQEQCGTLYPYPADDATTQAGYSILESAISRQRQERHDRDNPQPNA